MKEMDEKREEMEKCECVMRKLRNRMQQKRIKPKTTLYETGYSLIH